MKNVEDIDELKKFFDPNPGFLGAAITIPTAVKKVADKLNGKKMTLRKAVAMIQEVTDGKVTAKDGWIALWLHESNDVRHVFRVIRFR